MPKVKQEPKQKAYKAEAPIDTPVWKGRPFQEAKEALIAKIREGMPSVIEMKTQAFGILRKHQEWERRVRPYIQELSQMQGQPVSVERYRPGR